MCRICLPGADAGILFILTHRQSVFVVREPNVVELKPWKSIHNTIKEPMVTGLGGMDIPESVPAMGFARITKPDSLGAPAHRHPHDQWMYLIGETHNFADFDADIEMRLGKKIVKINYPCYIFIFSQLPLFLVVIHNLDFRCFSIIPMKAQPPLIVDPNTHSPFLVALEILEIIAGRISQVLQS
jgi:hypothetical protein